MEKVFLIHFLLESEIVHGSDDFPPEPLFEEQFWLVRCQDESAALAALQDLVYQGTPTYLNVYGEQVVWKLKRQFPPRELSSFDEPGSRIEIISRFLDSEFGAFADDEPTIEI